MGESCGERRSAAVASPQYDRRGRRFSKNDVRLDERGSSAVVLSLPGFPKAEQRSVGLGDEELLAVGDHAVPHRDAIELAF